MLHPDRLRKVREMRGYSQRQFAIMCGLSNNQMNRYEQGLSDPSTDILTTIADELGVSIDYLVGRTDDLAGFLGEQLRSDQRKLLDAYMIGDGTTMFMLMYERLKKLGKSPHHEEITSADG